MKRIGLVIAFAAAALVGAFAGDVSRPRMAQATAIGVSVQCSTVTLSSTGSYIFSCANAPADSSGIGVQMTITAPTNRYPLGTPATLTLP